jgi:hypothetical protein
MFARPSHVVGAFLMAGTLVLGLSGCGGSSSDEVKVAADQICKAGIYEMLKLESPNLHEIMLDRVIAYGHT